MTISELGNLVQIVCAALLICVAVARAASGRRASALWGLLGPLGVLVAGLRGVQERLDDLKPPKPKEERRATKGVNRAADVVERAKPVQPSREFKCQHCQAVNWTHVLDATMAKCVKCEQVTSIE